MTISHITIIFRKMLSRFRQVFPLINKHNLRTLATSIATVEDFEREFYSSNVASYEDRDRPFYFSIIESNLHLGQNKPGVGFGPMHLINSKEFRQFSRHATDNKNWHVQHRMFVDGNSTKKTEKNKQIKNGHQIDEITSRIFTANQYSEDVSDLTINLLGDHSASIGTIVSDFPNNNQILIWFDAHADINTPSSSLTGHCHGMPLSIASGLCQTELKKHNLFSWIPNYFPLENLIYIGLRDIDPFEKAILKQHNIMVLQENSNIDEYDDFFQKIDNALTHISFDVDVLDPKYFPCTGTPVKNGMTPHFVKYLMGEINKRSRVYKLDVVEYNPHISPKDIDRCNKTIVDTLFMPLLE